MKKIVLQSADDLRRYIMVEDNSYEHTTVILPRHIENNIAYNHVLVYRRLYKFNGNHLGILEIFEEVT